MSIVSIADRFGCAIADITTGDCFLTEVPNSQKLVDEINKFSPAEIICNDSFFMSGVDTDDLKERLGICIFSLDAWYFDDDTCRKELREHFHVTNLEGLGISDYDSGIIAAGALFLYLKETQKTALSQMTTIRPYTAERYMLIDSSSRRNLELVETLREKQKRGSLLWVLDKTKTAMGARTLRSFVEQPLIDAEEINRRLEALEELNEKPMLRDEIREYLNPVYDLERLAQKDGGIIREGFNEDVDKFRSARTDGKKWLTELETKERERTGIKSLKIKYNRVFGYALEVTNTFKELVPENYIRKQTLANAERYITEELKNLENMILGAEDKLYALEYELFSNVRDKVGQEVIRIQRTAKAIAGLDVFASLALVAERNHYVRPKVNEGGIIDIKGGRHPVVEQMIDNDMFIANDTYLDNTKKRVSIITGPNMAGKSTYMRQTALIVLMAQIGSFVPADKAVVGIVDRIFTRVGASDDLASGQSTFMVEMTEVANILRNATAKSLLILDEIGRGTSTFDGLAIAWAVIEHISNIKLCGAKTLFATHYHELTELEGKLSGVTNYCIAVKEKGDDIVFLRKIVKGGADKSYGIQVAKLAGVPDSVINRAKELVEELSDADITAAVKDLASPKKKPKVEMDMAQMSLFDTVQDNDIIEELKGIDIGNLTPMEALNTLYNLQNKIKNRW